MYVLSIVMQDPLRLFLFSMSFTSGKEWPITPSKEGNVPFGLMGLSQIQVDFICSHFVWETQSVVLMLEIFSLLKGDIDGKWSRHVKSGSLKQRIAFHSPLFLAVWPVIQSKLEVH